MANYFSFLGDLFKIHGAIKDEGIMGMNCRNIRFISRYNKRALYPLVDNKLKTKQLALTHNVKVPDLLSVVKEQHDIPKIFDDITPGAGFCIKPAQGSGGKGILVVLQGPDNTWQRSDGRILTASEIERHISNILAGIFSLGGKSDVAIVEELIQVDPVFQAFTYEGVPDLRIIIFRGFPVMAMMRLSCHASHGKANLHQGAVGVGIDIISGKAVNAVQKGIPVLNHPDTQQPLMELSVPHWHEMLKLACACYDMTGLGYLGVDIVLDKNKGPLLLELNARPGLAIQVANNAGLLPRLNAVERMIMPKSIDQRIDMIQDLIKKISTEKSA
jgi:alpha-L-glutamate ligase-like protein